MREARKLRSNHENIELLKEKLLEEKSHRERAESELSKLHDVQSNMKKLEDQISLWRSTIKDIPGISCFEDMPAKFAALQKYVNSYLKFCLLGCFNRFELSKALSGLITLEYSLSFCL